MGRLRRPELPGGPLATLFDQLRRLHIEAGEPSSRHIARQAGISHDTVHRTLTGPALPRWTNVELVVHALDGDVEAYRARWLAARAAEEPARPAAGPAIAEHDPPAVSVDDPIPAPDGAQVRIVVVDGHPVFRFGLVTVLRNAGVTVVAEAGDGEAAVRACSANRPDLVVSDIAMPIGLDVIARLSAENPRLGVLVLTALDDTKTIVRALSAGVRGYLLKNAEPEVVVDAVRRVLLGEAVLAPRAATAAMAGLHRAGRADLGLTSRETELIRLLTAGTSHKSIASALGVSVTTVRHTVINILGKLGLTNQIQLVRYAIEHDLTD